jgi:hypothetical protein
MRIGTQKFDWDPTLAARARNRRLRSGFAQQRRQPTAQTPTFFRHLKNS